MLPIPHILLFLPISVFAFLSVIAFAVNCIASLMARSRPAKPAPSRAVSQPSAQIIYFRPRKTSLPSSFGGGVRQRAIPR